MPDGQAPFDQPPVEVAHTDGSNESFVYEPGHVQWRTHVFSARTTDTELRPQDPDEIAGARWGTLEELGGELRERLLTTGRAFWRYRVALHDAALSMLARS